MPPRLNLFPAARALPIRPRVPIERWRPSITQALQSRCFADSRKDLPISENNHGPNTDPAPHVSEEAAETAKIMGDEGPDMNQGTPVEETVKGDKEAQEKLPKVMKDAIKAAKPSNSRSFSTSSRYRSDGLDTNLNTAEAIDPTIISMGMAPTSNEPVKPGLKFGMPTLPLPAVRKRRSTGIPDYSKEHRYDPIVEQLVGLLIRHGKKGVAHRNVALILSHLRTSSPPTLNHQRPLLPGHPPPSHLPLNPVLYLTLAIDSIAPLLRIRQQRGAAGGGTALQIPVPLGLHQRRRTAIMWILDSASKRKSRGSGKGMFAQRIADTLVSVVEGKSELWTKREAIHKLGVAARASLNLRSFGRR